MEFILSLLAAFYTHLRLNQEQILLTTAKGIIRLLFFIAACFLVPFSVLRNLKNPKRCPLNTNKLLYLSATELARKIRKKEITSEEVVRAYITRCQEVNPIINAIVQDRFEEALKEAREIDILLKNKVNTEEFEHCAPLLGIPITVKESIAVKGMSNSAGVKRLRPKIATEDADVVKKTRLAGGIPLLVSNTPEMCFCWETYNNVTGSTKNPYDSRRTSGGSSGGEGALLGSGASVLGLASDIGGSCRLPAMFCGVFGHKPTPGWVSVSGHTPGCIDKQWPLFFCMSPMVRYAEDLPMILKVISQDSTVTNCLNQKVDLKSIRYFYIDHNSNNGAITSIDDDMKSAIDRLTTHLKNTYGTNVEKANVKELKYALEFATTALTDIEGVESIFMKDRNPSEWKSVYIEVLKYLCCLSPHSLHAIFYGILKKSSDKLPKSFKNRMEELNKTAKKQLEEILGDNGVLIYPTFPAAAHFPYQILYKLFDVTYMTIFNAFGFPVTQCPMGLNRNGLPIGLQIAASPRCDHLTIAVAQDIERAFGGWQPPPYQAKII